MMKLYYSPGSSSMASHIALEEAGALYEAVRVNLKDKTAADGSDFNFLDPKGYVPALLLDNGEVYTENTALLAWIGAQNPRSKLIPPEGTQGNYRVREWLGFLSTELHKTVSPLFRSTTPEATVAAQRELLGRRLAYTEQQLADNSYLTGETFTVADAMLFTILNWLGRLQIDMTPYPRLKALHARVAERPAVIRVMTAEGLIKPA
jgi:glutathione S-transferase